MDSLTIGKLAKRVGVKIDTIRFYERKGLMEAPARSEGGYRLYSVSDLNRLRFIRRAKQLGFTLEEIKLLLRLASNSESSCEAVKTEAGKKLSDIQERIEDLQNIARALRELLVECEQRGESEACPLLKILT